MHPLYNPNMHTFVGLSSLFLNEPAHFIAYLKEHILSDSLSFILAPVELFSGFRLILSFILLGLLCSYFNFLAWLLS